MLMVLVSAPPTRHWTLGLGMGKHALYIKYYYYLPLSTHTTSSSTPFGWVATHEQLECTLVAPVDALKPTVYKF